MARKKSELIDDAPAETPAHLIVMTKDGEEIPVHPSTVDAHVAAGWQVKE